MEKCSLIEIESISSIIKNKRIIREQLHLKEIIDINISFIGSYVISNLSQKISERITDTLEDSFDLVINI